MKEPKKAYITSEERKSEKIRRNSIIAHETDRAYLLKLDSDKEVPACWFPRRYIKFVGTKSNAMTARKVLMVEYPTWLFIQRFRHE